MNVRVCKLMLNTDYQYVHNKQDTLTSPTISCNRTLTSILNREENNLAFNVQNTKRCVLMKIVVVVVTIINMKWLISFCVVCTYQSVTPLSIYPQQDLHAKI